MYFNDLQCCAQLAISIHNWCKGLTFGRMHGQWTNTYKKQGAPDWRPLFICLMLFTCAVPHTKSTGLPIDVPYSSVLSFLHAQCRIQKWGAPNWLPLFICLMLFTFVVPHTKSKGLPIDVPKQRSSSTFCTRKGSRSWLTYHCTFHTIVFINIWKAWGIYIFISTRCLSKSEEKMFVY
jgi:hypothetical protein